ncbi:sulfite exporter TauE/SafE family protein [Geomonas sp. Red32]|uniref:sulfite exporter TauE/SafE family protein n=1 Tax=Geomonas sp. Red32 TaxID=2912856 RepID=UPI00202D0708|nr:sulfite exporter TauE/SafE family protein [Geomonas sp. Red32]MCM0080891.1 sulfite exporter TauE/SafE family protein [Geomonas sp. Red32]
MQMVSHNLWIGFAGGLLAFAHCLGMCGGFVLHLSQEKDRNRMVAGQLLWQGGRILTYTLLGAVAGYAGSFLSSLFFDNPLFRNLLTYLAGGVIILMGLSLLGLLPIRGTGPFSSCAGLIASFSGKFFKGNSPGAALTLGMATGFLPCPIVVAFLAYALQTGSAMSGTVTMFALGVGTSIPLLTLGVVTRISKLHLRSWAPKAGGVILILLGVTTALRGTAAFHHLLGCPSGPAHQEAVSQEKPCCTGKMHNGGGI